MRPRSSTWDTSQVQTNMNYLFCSTRSARHYTYTMVAAARSTAAVIVRYYGYYQCCVNYGYCSSNDGYYCGSSSNYKSNGKWFNDDISAWDI